jgi:hypothetical protein
MPYVKFFRAIKGPYGPPENINQGALVDVHYLGGPYLSDSSYEYKAADFSLPTVYRLGRELGHDLKDKRITRHTFIVTEVKTKKIMLTYTQLHYSWRHPDRGILEWFGPAGFVGCPLDIHAGLDDKNEINQKAYKE